MLKKNETDTCKIYRTDATIHDAKKINININYIKQLTKTKYKIEKNKEKSLNKFKLIKLIIIFFFILPDYYN